jgi:hypothetical protein
MFRSALGGLECTTPEQRREPENGVGRGPHGPAQGGQDFPADQVGGFRSGPGSPKRLHLDQQLPQLGAGAIKGDRQPVTLLGRFRQGLVQAIEQLAPCRWQRIERAERAQHGIAQPIQHEASRKCGFPQPSIVGTVDGSAENGSDDYCIYRSSMRLRMRQ